MIDPAPPSGRTQVAERRTMVDDGADPADELFHRAPCGYVLTTDDATITAVNDTFLAWSGYGRAQVVGRKLTALLPIGDRILYATHCQPLLAMVGVVSELAIDVLTPGGGRRAALLSAARSAAADHPPVVRVVIFGAHEHRRYEKTLLAARRVAAESDAQRADAEAEAHHLARHDAMTGLLNRAGLTALLHQLFSASPPTRPGLSLVFIDLDHFKAINDSLGHSAGDALIVMVAQRLRAALRHGSTIARLAGDEFVVVETVHDTTELITLAQRLLAVINHPVTIDGIEIVPSASIGAAVSDPHDNGDQLLRHADIAMHRAKASGRNTWHLHDPLIVDTATGRLRVIGELRRGISNSELRVHYQPRIDLGTGHVHSAEALVRWKHPTRGLLAPAEFIDIAEESGLIRALGADVLDQAVAQTTRWNRTVRPHRPLEIAVNLSARQLNDPDMIGIVTGILNRHGLDPALLTLEITETALMTDPDAATRALTALNALGIVLAIDDFGTGYSSFTYLKQFPVQELKIDRSFVAGLGTDTGDTAIVASCIQLAHAVGIRAVAEGVETEAQRDVLVDLKCDLAQGFYLGRPVPAASFDTSEH